MKDDGRVYVPIATFVLACWIYCYLHGASIVVHIFISFGVIFLYALSLVRMTYWREKRNKRYRIIRAAASTKPNHKNQFYEASAPSLDMLIE